MSRAKLRSGVDKLWEHVWCSHSPAYDRMHGSANPLDSYWVTHDAYATSFYRIDIF